MSYEQQITREQIKDVQPVEIALWMGRFGLIGVALEATKGAWIEGWGEGGYTAWSAAEAAEKGQDWQAAQPYQELIMLELEKLRPTRGSVPDLRTDHARPPTAPQDFGRMARQVAMERIKLLDDNPPELAPAALAVYAYFRGDIRQPADRYIYEHKEEEIATMSHSLQQSVHPRFAGKTVLARYSELMYQPDGVTVNSYQRVWGQLQHDLALVDEAAATLRTTGNL